MHLLWYSAALCFLFVFSQSKGSSDSPADTLMDMGSGARKGVSEIEWASKKLAEYQNINIDSAVFYSELLLKLSQKAGDNKILGRVYLDCGSAFFNYGNYNRVISYYFKSLEYYEKTGTTSDLFILYFNIGLVYDKLKDPKKAREYYLKAMKIAEDNQDSKLVSVSRAIGRIYNNIGITYSDEGDFDKALEYYTKAIAFSEKSNNLEALNYVYNNIGIVYKLKGEYKIALSFYNKELKIKEEKADWNGISLTWYYIGECNLQMGNNTQAIIFLEKAQHIADSTGNIEIQRMVSENLVDAYAAISEYKKSYQAQLKYKVITDSLNLSKGLATATMLDMQHKFDKSQADQEVAQHKAEYRLILVFTFSTAFLIAVLLLYILAKNRVKRNRLEKEKLDLEKETLAHKLESKNLELISYVNFLLRKNELIVNISERLVKLKPLIDREQISILNSIVIDLQSGTDKDMWDEFEVRFQQVNEDFYSKLLENHPDLSSNEKKLCAFIHLGMNNKDISALTNQTVHSIDVARNRLRKKLNIINTETSLEEYLSRF